MADISDEADKLMDDYHNLEVRLDQHKAFRDSLENDAKFRTHFRDSGSTKAVEQMQEIKTTIQQRQAILNDKEKLTRRLEVFNVLNNLSVGLMIITMLILLVGLLKGR